MCLSIEVWRIIFTYLRDLDSIEVSALCKEWNFAVKSARFSTKLAEVNQLCRDKSWLLKTYRNYFDTFKLEAYWEILNRLFALNRNFCFCS